MSRNRKRIRPTHRRADDWAYRLGVEACKPADVRKTVFSGLRYGWSRVQIAKRCQITIEEVDYIIATRGQKTPSPLEGGGKRGGDMRHKSRLTPSGITAQPHTDAWFAQNQESFVAGMRELGFQPQENRNGETPQ